MGQNAIDDHEVATITNEVDTIIKEVDNNKDKEEEEEKEDNDDKEEEEGQKEARRAKGGPKSLRLLFNVIKAILSDIGKSFFQRREIGM